jgi:hypothetical protein
MLTYRKRPPSTPRMHRTFGVALNIGALLLITGCTAEVTGLAGVSVDERGNPIAVAVACAGKFDSATLEDVSNFDTITLVREWSFSANKAMRWNIVESPTATHPKPGGTLVLKPEVLYDLKAFNTEAQTTSGSVTFTAADVARLRPGQVGYLKENLSGGTAKYVVVNESTFESLVCKETTS